ncbi:MAG: hypothetical protein ACAF42_00640 [Limnothrix sp. BL-A-16]
MSPAARSPEGCSAVAGIFCVLKGAIARRLFCRVLAWFCWIGFCPAGGQYVARSPLQSISGSEAVAAQRP